MTDWTCAQSQVLCLFVHNPSRLLNILHLTTDHPDQSPYVDEPTFGGQQHTMLLQLPAELILGILSFLDPTSFYQCLLVCKTLVSHVRGSKKLLKQQIASVPGSHGYAFKKFLRIASASELLTVFAQRSKSHLLHGRADVTQFKLASPKYKLGAFASCMCDNSHMFMAVVNAESGAIGVHHVGLEGIPSLKCILAPQTLGLAGTEEIKFKVLKCAFPFDSINREGCLDRLAVLYSYNIPGSTTEPFVQQAQQQSKLMLKLVTWRLWAPIRVEYGDVQNIYIGDGRVPTALALAESGTAAVAFHSPDRLLGWSEEAVWEAEHYGWPPAREFELMRPSSIVARSGQVEGLLAPSEIQIVKNRALFSFPVAPTPQWEMTDVGNPSTLTQTTNNFENLIRTLSLEGPSIGHFLHCRHQHVNRYLFGERVCINEVLQLHFQAHGDFHGAYIVKGVKAAPKCAVYDETDRHEGVHHRVVAHLDGIDHAASRSCSLGQVLAILPQGNRIAIASWDRVQVWTFEPDAFYMQVENHIGFEKACLKTSGIKRLDRMVERFGATKTLIDEGFADASDLPGNPDTDTPELDEVDWLRNCGFDFYGCYRPKRIPIWEHGPDHEFYGKTHQKIVRLKPVGLPRCGVVHSLKFLNDETLWGWTDHGPVCWHLGDDMSGRRWEEQLALSIDGASCFSDSH
ncbi:hypothetical protein HDK64DRAFT_96201 [Phyllosticta capitalensis]